jgi:hypothetical protein
VCGTILRRLVAAKPYAPIFPFLKKKFFFPYIVFFTFQKKITEKKEKIKFLYPLVISLFLGFFFYKNGGGGLCGYKPL